MTTSALSQPFITETESRMAAPAPSVTTGERKTYSPYLQSRIWEQHEEEQSALEHKVGRFREEWNSKAEALLMTWSTAWDAKAEAHGVAEANKRWRHLCLQVPTVLVPIALAPLLSSQFISEQSPIVVISLVMAGLTGALQSILQLERKSEQHAQAAFRYSDLLTDAEEVLCKERLFRPPMDVTISKFKMRMDSAERYSPPVVLTSSPSTRGKDHASTYHASTSDLESEADKSELVH